jgi:glycosyltransferase involved in cell wall biosynthesis
VVYARDAVVAAWFGAGLARLCGARLIYEVHDLEQWNPSRARSPWARPLVRLIDRAAIRGADGVVSLTAAFRDYLDRVGLKAARDVAVIPDAYDDARYAPGDRDAARAALGLPRGAFVVTYAGLTFAYRGLDALVRAFADLCRDVPGSLLVLVGGREGERAELARLARELGVADAVLLPGQRSQDEVPRYLAAADALVLPGTVSGLNASPLKLFEYAAMARPIVAADLPALREVLGDDGAHYVPPGDVAGLRAALDAIRRDPARARELAVRARERVAPFTYRARARAILAWAERVAQLQPPPAPPIPGGRDEGWR